MGDRRWKTGDRSSVEMKKEAVDNYKFKDYLTDIALIFKKGIHRGVFIYEKTMIQ